MNSSALILIGTLLLAGGPVHAQDKSRVAPSASAEAAPTDPQIAQILVTANQVDIDAGKLAESKASTNDVKVFGRQMVTDHTGVNRQTEALVKKLKMTPEENPTSKSLKTSGDETLGKLKGMKGKGFDKAYIDSEVAFHQTVLDSIDKTLLPSARNDELKSLITKVRPAIADHLEHAKRIQASLAR